LSADPKIFFRDPPEEELREELTIRGEIPEWLSGNLIRTCPAIFEYQQWSAHHLFDGLCMLYSFQIQGGAVSYRNRFLKSKAFDHVLAGRDIPAGFAQSPQRPFLQRVFRPVPDLTDNANVNVDRYGDDFVAMTETPHQIQFDPTTLKTIGRYEHLGDVPDGASLIAHPQWDPITGDRYSIASEFGPISKIHVYRKRGGTGPREIVGTYRTTHYPYIHSFSLTPRFVILTHHPFTAQPITMLGSNKGFIDHFTYHPDRPTIFVIMDRSDGSTWKLETSAFFTFHTANAYEHGDEIVVDLLTHPNAEILGKLQSDKIKARTPTISARLTRFRLNLNLGSVREDHIGPEGFEFPTYDYARRNSQSYQHCYAIESRRSPDDTLESRVAKINTDSGSIRTFSETAWFFGEALFVHRGEGHEEDDGVLLSVAGHRERDETALVILNAQDLSVRAWVTNPDWIPPGFHGQFFP
jgi:carotenoid cleavage dioxygenase-like enzyme